MTREEAVNRLCDIYSGEFDVRLCEEHRKPLAAQMDFYAESSKYVLSKKAKLWEANSFEYVYLFNVPHLTREIYDQCEKLAYDEGMARIKPGPNHMYTYITALFVCDSCDEDAKKALKQCKLYKSFKMSYWGWMDFHTALAVLPEESVSTNRSGHSAAQVFNRGLFHKQKRKLVQKGESFMNAALFLIIGCAVLVVGYIFYGGWLAKKWGVDNSRAYSCS